MATLQEKLISHKIASLRREEDEETWISGEELYTEGSSDEEASKKLEDTPRTQSHVPLARRISAPAEMQVHCAVPPSVSSEPTEKGGDLHLSEATRRLSQMGLSPTIWEDTSAAAASVRRKSEDIRRVQDKLEEQEKVMLWRPKRGSFKLPHHEAESRSTPSSSQSTQ